MTRIFEIEGNFEQNGEWSKPDPGFRGEFVVGDDGELHGYMHELYDTPYDKLRFVIGHYSERGLCFFKLVNDPRLKPLRYAFFGKELSGGEWSALEQQWGFGLVPGDGMALFSDGAVFVRRGSATLTLREAAYTQESADKIDEIFGQLERGEYLNRALLERIGLCRDYLEN